MRVVLPFKLVGQKLVKGRDFPKSVADGSKNTIVVKVDGIPENADANAYFKLSWENGTVYDQAFDGNELVVEEYIFTLPAHANNKYIEYKVSMSVAVFEGGEERLTTYPVEFVLKKSNYSDDTTNTPEIPQSQYELFLDNVKGYSVNPPKIGENGNWFVWNGTDYEDTGKPSVGGGGEGGGGSSIVVDNALDINSENPVQNRVVAEKFNEMTEWHNGMADIVNGHTEAIRKLEENGGSNIVVDDKLDPISANPVENRVIVSALGEMSGTVADAKSIANTANNTASNAQNAANSAINKAKEANDKADALAERVTFLEDVDVVTSVNGMDGAVQLTASDVGALPSTTKIPSKVSDLTNDKGYLTDYTETDPTVPSWAKATSKPTYTASEVGARPNTWMPNYSDVGADKAGTANNAVATHNTNEDAHNDIRLLIAALTTRLDALANSDDTTLDQMAEVVAYIKDNRNLIEQITTGKVSVADIVNNLTTNVTNKPLSSAQGVALKALIDAITVPTKLSELAADNSSLHVSYSEKTAWNNKSDFSGAYADLTGKPTIPTVPTKVSAFTNDAGYLTDYEETDPTVPSWAKAASKPSYTKSEVGLGNVDNVKQYSASNPPPYPVTSVNGKTGAVTVSVPTKTSQLTNDSGFLTAHQDISGKANKSDAETWTFTLEDGSTVTKKVVLA